MSILAACFYDRFVSRAEAACPTQRRRELLGRTCGDVPKIGAGTGASIAVRAGDAW